MNTELPDFTQPHPHFQRTEIKGEVLWVPRHIRYVANHWRISCSYRITEIRVTNPLKSLQDAWLLLQARRQQECPDKPPLTGTGRKKDLDTGVIGVRISVVDGHCRVWTQQKLAPNRHRQCPVSSISLDKLSQAWLDKALADAASIRYYYLFLSMEVPVSHAIRYCDVPPEHRRTEPVRSVSVREVLRLAEEKEVEVLPSGKSLTQAFYEK